ncbi:MAG: sulfite reductase flavoprotein subunit alpha, partial [Pseudomonadota bacterium]
NMKCVLFVCATYGEGEMPDNALLFWEALTAPDAPRLEGLQYSVLGLGDQAYEHFCNAGKILDRRLEELGAKRILPRVDCDIDYEENAEAWMAEALPLSQSIIASLNTTGDASAAATSEAEPAAPKKAWGRKNPYPATVLENRKLSGEGSTKDMRHMVVDLGDSGITYEAGDSVGVMPVNNSALIEQLLARLGADAGMAVPDHDKPLGELLRTHFEILTPPRSLIQEIEKRAGHSELSAIAANGDKEALEAFLWNRDTLDMLNLNPGLQVDPLEFVSWLKPLQHRSYSIASSPILQPTAVDLTVAALRWTSEGRAYGGVASTYLADDCPLDVKIPLFLAPNRSFRIPEDNTAPVIMVGPGTGVAPFRAFLQEREALGAPGRNWLFFGDRNRAMDFAYEDDFNAMSTSGLLTRLDLAFSRDRDEKIYVQNRMHENGRELFAWLEEGGYFYICGDATRMAHDVDAALHEIIAREGDMSEDKAFGYVSRLKSEKRYLRDVY